MRHLVLFSSLLLVCGAAFGGAFNRVGGPSGGLTLMPGYMNPARWGELTLNGPAMEFGMDTLFTKFQIDGPLGTAKSKTAAYPLPYGYYLYPLDDGKTIGLALVTEYGLGVQFDRDLRHGVFESETLLALTTLSAGYAFEVNDRTTLGVQLRLGYAQFKYAAPFDVADVYLPIYTDSKADGFGIGFALGVRHEITERLTLGLSYVSPLEVKLKGRTDILRGPLRFSDGFSSAVTFPPRATVELEYQATERLKLSAAVSWYGHSKTMNDITLDFNDLPLKKRKELDWRDNYSLHAGLEYQAKSGTVFKAAASYMTAAVPADTLSQLTPDGSGFSLAASISKQITKHSSLELGGMYSIGWTSGRGKDYMSEVLSGFLAYKVEF